MNSTGWPRGIIHCKFLNADLLTQLIEKTDGLGAWQAALDARRGNYDVQRATVHLSVPRASGRRIEQLTWILQQAAKDIHVSVYDESASKSDRRSITRDLVQRFEQAQRFIWVLDKAALSSPWRNWELGMANATKRFMDIAILPQLVDYEEEAVPYLLNYNRIGYDPLGHGGQGSIVVVGPDDMRMSLDQWLGS